MMGIFRNKFPFILSLFHHSIIPDLRILAFNWHLNFDIRLPAGRQGFGSSIFLILFGEDLKKLLLGRSLHQSPLEGRLFQQGDDTTQEL